MKTNRKEGIYQPFRNACERKNSNLSTVLNACGRSDGNTGSWKKGMFPRLDVAMDIADYLGISLDELCYGIEKTKASILTDDDREWLVLTRNIPANKQRVCKDFLRTHAADIPDASAEDPAKQEWLDIIERIPDDKKEMCKDFIKTHAVIPPKYETKEKVS